MKGEKMKKVLFFIPTLAHGGAEKVLVNLVNNLDKAKYKVTVLTIFDYGVNRQYLNHDIQYKSIFKHLFRGFSTMCKIIPNKLLAKLFIKEEYDIVISYLEGVTSKIVSGIGNEKCKKIAWIHIQMENSRDLKSGFSSLDSARKAYRHFNKIICVSQRVKECFLKLGVDPEKVEVLYNTNETEEIRIKSNENVKDCIFKKEEINLISVGKLVPAKGYDRLLSIHRRLVESGYPVHTRILGIGEDENKLRRRIEEYSLQDSFELLGYKDNPYKYVKNSDLYVCSSRKEGFSTSVTEALIVGTAVVSTNCSGAKEMLGSNNEYGIVSLNNEESLYINIKNILDYNEIPRMKEAAKVRGEKFEKCKTVNEVEKMLDGLCDVCD